MCRPSPDLRLQGPRNSLACKVCRALGQWRLWKPADETDPTQLQGHTGGVLVVKCMIFILTVSL